MTRRTMLQALRDTLRRRKRPAVDMPRTRISTAYWARTHTVVHPERDLSEWVHKVAERDWDAVVKGKNKR